MSDVPVPSSPNTFKGQGNRPPCQGLLHTTNLQHYAPKIISTQTHTLLQVCTNMSVTFTPFSLLPDYEHCQDTATLMGTNRESFVGATKHYFPLLYDAQHLEIISSGHSDNTQQYWWLFVKCCTRIEHP